MELVMRLKTGEQKILIADNIDRVMTALEPEYFTPVYIIKHKKELSYTDFGIKKEDIALSDEQLFIDFKQDVNSRSTIFKIISSLTKEVSEEAREKIVERIDYKMFDHFVEMDALHGGYEIGDGTSQYLRTKIEILKSIVDEKFSVDRFIDKCVCLINAENWKEYDEGNNVVGVAVDYSNILQVTSHQNGKHFIAFRMAIGHRQS